MTWSEHEPFGAPATPTERAEPTPAAEPAGPVEPATSITGSAESRISAGLGELDDLGSRALGEHAPVYESLHEQLKSVLAEIDGA